MATFLRKICLVRREIPYTSSSCKQTHERHIKSNMFIVINQTVRSKFTAVHAGTERYDAPSDHCKINTHQLDRDGRNQLTFQACVEANQYGLIATQFDGTI